MLNIITHGTPTRLPGLMIVHGLFGSARNWGAIAKRVSDDRQVLCVDMRNHGESPWYDRHGYDDLAADLAAVIDAQDGPMDVLGHSMGGKAAMMLALKQPGSVARLLIGDIAPVIYPHSQAALIDAMEAMDLTGLTSRSEADRRLAAHVDAAPVRAFLLQSLDLKASPPRWRLNLPVLRAEMDRITGWPADVTGTFDRAALFLSGAQSDYVQPEHRAPIKALFPQARFAKIPDAGHWLHADQPRAFEAVIRSFFDAA
ncbi:alpha/beta fold hydrolase [Roseicitreum antarcticum]|uniref:Pimeloyl-ACP methyl ester carboxylesterase n=1 Tax=Roseicitreum antarcticum TaxID=564137 RepID=A0A1H2UQ29_9RHOB|nr:alpha/beta fold hydrolase [Roseicitreum antarcticum]SDW58247.1 Pimeloyl-ACP methyl ester carboxylesterase [Roseicitreum antarcticum]